MASNRKVNTRRMSGEGPLLLSETISAISKQKLPAKQPLPSKQTIDIDNLKNMENNTLQSTTPSISQEIITLGGFASDSDEDLGWSQVNRKKPTTETKNKRFTTEEKGKQPEKQLRQPFPLQLTGLKNMVAEDTKCKHLLNNYQEITKQQKSAASLKHSHT